MWPEKTREYFHNHCDSTLWNDFPFRDDDIIIGTYAKSGTTWLQQIVSQLVFDARTDIDVADLSPWIDMVVPPREVKFPAIEEQSHRRFLKTHLPVDALVYSPQAKYIYIARDGRDVVWSFHHHHTSFTAEAYEALNNSCSPDVDKLLPPNPEIHEYFLEWLERDGYPLWSFWDNISSWWAIRNLPNMKLLHFSALKSDMPGQIREIAEFLNISIDEDKWDNILEHCSFDYMKANAEKSTPLGGALFEGGAKTFINKGVNGRWHDVLSDADNQNYEQMAIEKLGPECAHWLKTGEVP